MFRNVLVWIDGSAGAAQGLAAAVETARASGGRLGLLGVAARPRRAISLALPPFAPPASPERLAAQLEEDAQRHLDEAARTVPADVPVTKLLAHGSVSDALLEHTRDGPWDLLVVGLPGAAGQRPPRRGPGTRVLRAGSIPVLVMPNPSGPAPPKRPPMPVITPPGRSPASLRARAPRPARPGRAPRRRR